MMNNIYQDNNPSSQLNLSMDMVFIPWKTLENIQDTSQLFQDWTTISVDSKNNGSQESNTELMLTFITSKFKSNSSHSCVMLTLKLIIMEVPQRLLFCKLIKKLSIPEIISTKLIHGMKLRNSTHTKPSKEPINTFFLNSLISDSTKSLLLIQLSIKMEDTSD